MLSSSSPEKPKVPFLLSFGLDNAKSGKKGKALSAEEKYSQALATAEVFIGDSRARITKSVQKMESMAENKAIFYGCYGGNALAALVSCLGIGNRFPVVRAYSGWIALIWGYLGGSACLSAYRQYLMNQSFKVIDNEIKQIEEMDMKTDHILSDYTAEAERLTKLRHDLESPNERSTSENARKGNEELADELVEKYIERKALKEKLEHKK